MSRIGDAAGLAVGTLTVLPVRPPRQLGGGVAGLAMALAPIAVLPLALAAAAVVWAGDALGGPAPLTATLAVAALVIGTGGLHLDGLADTADGFAVPGDRVRRLEAMRRSDVGPVGVVALVLAVLVQVTALADVVSTRTGSEAAVVVGLGVVVSRAAVTLACARGVPAARADGLGSGVAGSVPLLGVLGVLAALLAGAGVLAGERGMAGLGLAVAGAGLVLVRSVKTLGGVTGDVMGACVEVALAGYLAAQVMG